MKKTIRYFLPEEIVVSAGLVAPLADCAVLIYGETGTGKTFLARHIHELSGRSGNLVEINCSSIPAELFESELFGHKKGAFTGAVSERPGKLREASGGTVFLDEVAELPYSLQVKLLKVLEDRHVTPLGSDRSVKIDFRLICATNKDPYRAIESGELREDLFYRINQYPLYIPPLRERREQITEIAIKLARDISIQNGKEVTGLNAASLERLLREDLPGNIREIAGIIRYSLIRLIRAEEDEDILDLDFEGYYRKKQENKITISGCSASFASPAGQPCCSLFAFHKEPVTLEEFKYLIVQHVFRTSGNNSVTSTARILGITTNTARKYLDTVECRN